MSRSSFVERRTSGVKGLYRRGGKRFMDAALAAAGLILFSIPMGIIVCLVYQELRLSPLFRQIRIGHKGKEFMILKFRTMSEEGVIRPFGRWLRITALDELPQLVHILKGEMSFVGPRPLVPEELRELNGVPGGARRFEVRPGLTGLAQINSAKVPALPERLRWDTAYVDRLSPVLDLKILLKSVWISLRASWERH